MPWLVDGPKSNPTESMHIAAILLPADGHCKSISLRSVDAGLADAEGASLRKLLVTSICTAGAIVRDVYFRLILKAHGFV